jgi:uncharacterized protein with beta-barrel porin domain
MTNSPLAGLVGRPGFRSSGRTAAGGTALAAGLALLAATPGALAQDAPNAMAFSELEGLNAAQIDIGLAIDAVCPSLVGAGNANLNAEQQNLRDVCQDMVANARNVGTGGFGLDQAELAGALQILNAEETEAPEVLLSRARSDATRAVQGRLAATRSGIVQPGTAQIDIDGMDLGSVQFASLDATSADVAQVEAAEDGISPNLYFGNLGVFLIGGGLFGEQDATGEIESFDYDGFSITAGADYRVTDELVVGGAFTYSNQETEFDQTINSTSGQEIDGDFYTISAYGSYFLPNDFYIDGVISYGWIDYDATRRIVIVSETAEPSVDETANADYDGNQFAISVGAGRDFYFDEISLSPFFRLAYLDADIDAYTETGANGLGFAFEEQDIDSLTTQLGLQASYSISTGFGVVLPYARGVWVHEFEDEDPIVARYASDPFGLSTFTITPVDRTENYGRLGGGVSATLPNGWSGFVDYETIVGIDDFSSHQILAGVRAEF